MTSGDPPPTAALDRLAQALAELSEVQLELEEERSARLKIESSFESVLSAMSDAVVLSDARGSVVKVNDAALVLVGRDATSLLGAPVRTVFGADVPSTAWELLDRSPGVGTVSSIEGTALTADRGEVAVSVSASVLRDTSGKIVGAVYAARDLSETLHLVHELAEAEFRWRLLADVSELLDREVRPAGALPDVCRRLGTGLRVSVAIVLVDGLAVDEVVTWPESGSLADLQAIKERPLERGSALGTAVHDGRSVHASRLAPDFPLLPVPARGVRSAAVVPVCAGDDVLGAVVLASEDEGGVAERPVVVATEVAARVGVALAAGRLRDELSRHAAARDADRFRQDVLAAASHDMQTPLAVILGSLAALEDAVPADHADTFQAMSRQARRLGRLVRKFLHYSRLEEGRSLTVRPVPSDVVPVIRVVAADMAAGRQIDVRVPDGPLHALVNPEALDQVLANLLSNAIKFSPPETPVVIEATATGALVEISVADSGRGMDPPELANLFTKYYRGHSSAGTPGTGLGLYVSHALVTAQSGRIVAASSPGRGTRITVVLPAASATPRTG